jgi:hypothetical protein
VLCTDLLFTGGVRHMTEDLNLLLFLLATCVAVLVIVVVAIVAVIAVTGDKK